MWTATPSMRFRTGAAACGGPFNTSGMPSLRTQQARPARRSAPAATALPASPPAGLASTKSPSGSAPSGVPSGSGKARPRRCRARGGRQFQVAVHDVGRLRSAPGSNRTARPRVRGPATGESRRCDPARATEAASADLNSPWKSTANRNGASAAGARRARSPQACAGPARSPRPRKGCPPAGRPISARPPRSDCEPGKLCLSVATAGSAWMTSPMEPSRTARMPAGELDCALLPAVDMLDQLLA